MKSSIPIPISSIETSYNLSSCSISSLKPFLSSCPSLSCFSLSLSPMLLSVILVQSRPLQTQFDIKERQGPDLWPRHGSTFSCEIFVQCARRSKM
ncbi:hypothetical protein I3842_04G118500 [Carya illinoinensis]|uniref:Uncharacterized protein n=1 Tax=Carya illinoinensis TaxID=32201 RepID=A0A922FC37_CARIL|nr:hypothetical protein I3842_04G118500 [Carya illinoinensis]